MPFCVSFCATKVYLLIHFDCKFSTCEGVSSTPTLLSPPFFVILVTSHHLLFTIIHFSFFLLLHHLEHSIIHVYRSLVCTSHRDHDDDEREILSIMTTCTMMVQCHLENSSKCSLRIYEWEEDEKKMMLHLGLEKSTKCTIEHILAFLHSVSLSLLTVATLSRFSSFVQSSADVTLRWQVV